MTFFFVKELTSKRLWPGTNPNPHLYTKKAKVEEVFPHRGTKTGFPYCKISVSVGSQNSRELVFLKSNPPVSHKQSRNSKTKWPYSVSDVRRLESLYKQNMLLVLSTPCHQTLPDLSGVEQDETPSTCTPPPWTDLETEDLKSDSVYLGPSSHCTISPNWEPSGRHSPRETVMCVGNYRKLTRSTCIETQDVEVYCHESGVRLRTNTNFFLKVKPETPVDFLTPHHDFGSKSTA